MSQAINSIGFGTAAIGRPQYINIKQESSEAIGLSDFRKKGWETIENAYQQGIRYFDTAPGYGLAEELLIDWLKTKNDSTIQVATKWGYTYTANFDPNATQHEVKEHSLFKLNEQWEKSQLLLPHLKIYQIHSATFESGVLENKEILKKLLELKKAHKIEVGITTSGDNQIDVIKKALEVTVEGNSLFDAFQVTYNILDQSVTDVANMLKERNKKMILKEALANGRVFPNSKYPKYKALYTALQKLAKKYQVGIDAIAIRFCIDTLNPFMVLSGAADKTQVVENLKANTFQLESNEIKLLKSFKVAPKKYWEERKKLSWN